MTDLPVSETRDNSQPGGRRATLLMLGTVNHPHVEHLAIAMAERGLHVAVGGDVEPSLPETVLGEHGIVVHQAPRARRSTVSGLVNHVAWIRRLVRTLRPDAVHAHWMPGYAFQAALAGASPLAAMAWGSDIYRADRLRRAAGRFATRRAGLVMTDSSDLLARLEDLGAPPERTFLINWGVDLERFSPASGDRSGPRQRLGLAPGPTMLSPRSLAAVYNIPTIIDAFGRLGSEVGHLQLVLKHMGVENADLGLLPHPERIRMVGHVPYERMADYYRAADVCISAASSDSSPRSVWEAMACGCPVVVSDLPWVRELIEDERHALVVPIEPGAVANAVRRVLEDDELARELRENGRRLVEQHRSRDREMDRLACAYRELIGPTRPRMAAGARIVAT